MPLSPLREPPPLILLLRDECDLRSLHSCHFLSITHTCMRELSVCTNCTDTKLLLRLSLGALDAILYLRNSGSYTGSLVHRVRTAEPLSRPVLQRRNLQVNFSFQPWLLIVRMISTGQPGSFLLTAERALHAPRHSGLASRDADRRKLVTKYRLSGLLEKQMA